MKDYKKPVEALRHCVSDEKGVTKCAGCPYYPDITGCMDRLHADAAAAIEELQAEMKQAAKRNGQLHAELEKWVSAAEELQDKVFELEEELNDADIAADDNARQIEELQAVVKQLKEVNDELREAQTYIDHYGDKWMTSAKDVPTSAYQHGYADGRDEAMAKMGVQE